MSRSNAYRVEVVQPGEAASLIRAMEGALQVLDMPFTFEGHVSAQARELDGSIAWSIAQSNLITDMGRRHMLGEPALTGSKRICTSPSTEPPLAERSTLLDGGTGAGQVSGNLSGTYDTPTRTRTWATTLATPASAKTISIVGLVESNIAYLTDYGIYFLLAYTLLPTPKTQTTTQTLEVTYKITMTPMS